MRSQIKRVVLVMVFGLGLALGAGGAPAAETVLAKQSAWRTFVAWAPAIREDGKPYNTTSTYSGKGSIAGAGAPPCLMPAGSSPPEVS